MFRVSVFRVLQASLALGLAGCAGMPAPTTTVAPQRSESTVVSERLYFGRSIPGGGQVSDDEWKAFVAEVVVPRFPEGFTVFAANGSWRSADGTVATERSLVLEVVHDGASGSSRAIEEIAQSYVARFRQEAVMRVRLPAEQSFIRQR